MDASNVATIVVPSEVVELASLATADGAPARVKCDRLPRRIMATTLKALEGLRIKSGEDGEEPALDEAEALRRIEVLAEIGPPLVMAGTSFVGPDGEEVRPAFYWGERPHPLSIEGRHLMEEDLSSIVAAFLRLGGYIKSDTGDAGGVADAAFHGRDGVGGEARPGD